jgi:hypothetical protein
MYKRIFKEDVAGEILKQLGGNKFIVMTGAKNFYKGVDDQKQPFIGFKIGKAKNQINYVKIILTGRDDYTMQFLSIRGSKLKVVREVEGVYNDMLQDVFTTNTGLYTHL